MIACRISSLALALLFSCKADSLDLLAKPGEWRASAEAPATLKIVPNDAVPLAAELTADGGAEAFPRLALTFSDRQDWRGFDKLRVRLRIVSDDVRVEGKPLNFVFYDEQTRIENAPGNPALQQGVRIQAPHRQWLETEIPLREIRRSSIRTIELYAYENPPAVAHRCRIEIARLELAGPDSAATLFDGRSHGNAGLVQPRQPEARRLRTDDGLEVGLDDSGGVTSVVIDGKALGSAPDSLGGFFLRDAATADLPKRALGGLEFIPGYKTCGGYLEMSGALVNQGTGDRLITAYFVLPIGDSAWQWGESISAAAIPDAAAAFELTHTKYPLSALSLPQVGGLSLAIRMDEPVRYRLVYNPKQKLYFAAFDLAVTPEKPAASFRVILYRHDPAWGFRSALQRYYDFFPQFFEKRVSIDGGWGVWRQTPPTEDDLASGFAYSWGPVMEPNLLKAQQRLGILNLPYIEPEYWQMSLGDLHSASNGEALERLRRIAAGDDAEWERFAKLRYTSTDGSRHHRRQSTAARGFYRDLATATLHSLAGAPDGSLPAAVAKRDWIGDSGLGAMFPCNLDPDIPDGKGRFNTQVAIRTMFEDQEKATGVRMDGLSLDCFLGSAPDFRREHFRYLQGPLAFYETPVGLRPGIGAEWGSVDWMRDLKQQPWWDKRMLMANLVDSGGGDRLAFAAPYLDIFGLEHAWVPDPDFLRSMARNKPVTDLPYSPREPWVASYMQVHGIFPGEGHDHVLMKKMVPVLRSLMREGWEPVTGVRASTPDFRMERYGRYLAVHNKANQAVRGRVVPELKSLAPRDLSLEAKETVVLDLKSPPR
jgi:hypothetical protein